MKKILTIHQGNELYGSDRSFCTAVEAFSEVFEVDVVLPSPGEINQILPDGINSLQYVSKGILRRVELKSSPFASLFNIFTQAFSYRKLFQRYDCIYINTVVCISAILSCALCFKKKKVIHVREIPDRFQLMVFKAALMLARADIVYNSHATKQAFGLPGEVIYNGVENGERGFAARKSESALCLLMVGRINAWKGQGFFLESTYGVSKDIKFVIVGDIFEGQEAYKEEVIKLASESTYPVEISGYVSDPSRFYFDSDYVVVPSLKPEPFGRVAIEALSFGKPVISAGHGGLLEIIENNENGFQFSPCSKESLRSVVESLPCRDSDDYERLSESAISTFKQRFSTESYKSVMTTYMQSRV